jgi:CheY-like chemotaxis protein
MSTILVVDDNPDMHRLYRTALSRAGYRLMAASTGAEALLAMGMHFPDLIVLDMAMPDMDGLEFLRVVRQQPEWENIPVLMVTAFGTGQDFEATRHLGVAAHFVKADFSIKQLRATIASCLDESAPANAA